MIEGRISLDPVAQTLASYKMITEHVMSSRMVAGPLIRLQRESPPSR